MPDHSSYRLRQVSLCGGCFGRISGERRHAWHHALSEEVVEAGVVVVVTAGLVSVEVLFESFDSFESLDSEEDAAPPSLGLAEANPGAEPFA